MICGKRMNMEQEIQFYGLSYNFNKKDNPITFIQKLPARIIRQGVGMLLKVIPFIMIYLDKISFSVFRYDPLRNRVE